MKATPVKIRNYHENDFSAVMAIFKKNVPTYFSEIEMADLEQYLNNKLEIYLVVESEGALIGAGGINFQDGKKTGVISWDFIEPEFQGKGVGRKLLTHRIEILKSMDSIENIRVRTSQLTYQFYEKSGFKTQEIVKNYWAKGFDLYDMSYSKLF